VKFNFQVFFDQKPGYDAIYMGAFADFLGTQISIRSREKDDVSML